jgi:hypothetical protein
MSESSISQFGASAGNKQKSRLVPLVKAHTVGGIFKKEINSKLGGSLNHSHLSIIGHINQFPCGVITACHQHCI